MILILFISLFVVLLATSTVSAGFSEWFENAKNRITGRGIDDTTSLNLTIGNTAPVITFVETVAATDPVEDGTRTFIINFTANDDDGADDMENAIMNLSSTGEADRSNGSCSTSGAAFGNSQNYTCQIELYYFDANAAWTINITINDSANTLARNDTTSFTFNLLTAMKMSPTALTWPGLSITSTNTGSNNDPIVVNNTGNDVITNITVSALDLSGEVTTTENIYAENFTVNTEDVSDGTAMINASAMQILFANYTSGNHSLNDGTAQEQLYFYLEILAASLSSQSYSSPSGAEWTVAVVT